MIGNEVNDSELEQVVVNKSGSSNIGKLLALSPTSMLFYSLACSLSRYLVFS